MSITTNNKSIEAVVPAALPYNGNYSQLVRGEKYYMAYAVFAGTVTALTVNIEVSPDKTNWFQIGTHAFSAGEITAKAAVISPTAPTTPYPAGWVRAIIPAGGYTGTGAVTVHIYAVN